MQLDSLDDKTMNPHERESDWITAFECNRWRTLRTCAVMTATLVCCCVLGVFFALWLPIDWLRERLAILPIMWRECRKLAVLCLLSSALCASASEVTLAWDASPTPGCTYVLYATTDGTLTKTNMSQSKVIVDCGTNLTVKASGMTTPGTWRFGVTAKIGGVQSDLSNILILTVPDLPQNFRTVALQYAGTLDGLGTNPQTFFMRVKLGP